MGTKKQYDRRGVVSVHRPAHHSLKSYGGREQCSYLLLRSHMGKLLT